MKLFSRTLTILLAGSVVLISACSKTGPAGPAGSTGASGPSLTGNLKGHIYQYDQYGALITTGLAGIHDSLNPGHVAITDTNGFYAFNGLSTGEYNFTISKAGYGTNMVQSLQLVGGGDLYRDVKIAQIPGFNMTGVTATFNSATNNFDFVGSVASDTRNRYALLFLGKTSGVSSVPATYSNVYSGLIKFGVTTFTISVNVNDIHDLGIVTGNTLYCSLYAANSTYASASSYQDYATGRTVFTALGTTPVAANVVMP
jgi:hypothetical protein